MGGHWQSVEPFWRVGSHMQECGPGRLNLIISEKKGLPPAAVLRHAFALGEQKGREGQSPSVQAAAAGKYTFNTFKQKEIPSLTGFGCLPLTTAFYVDRTPGLPRAANL